MKDLLLHFGGVTDGQVAVSNDGSVFVSDGYCNSRVAKFAANGTHLGDFVLPAGDMNVPHSLVLEECSSTLLVADREASKVHRFDLSGQQHTGAALPAVLHY